MYMACWNGLRPLCMCNVTNWFDESVHNIKATDFNQVLISGAHDYETV